VSSPHLHRALLVLALVDPLSAAIINVGPGGAAAGCEAGDVASAVTLAAATGATDEIRVVNTQIFTLPAGIHLTDWNATSHGALTISGGWSSCTDTTASGVRSTLRYTGSAPVIEIDTTAGESSQVTLRTLRIEGSTGRGIVAQGDSTVDLLAVEVTENDGGGLQAESGASVYLDAASSLEGNGPAAEGGGLRCTGATTTVISAATILFNQAEFGGGVFAGAACEVIFDPGALLQVNDAAGDRAGDGGAIYAEGGAIVSAFDPLSIIDNDAAGVGAGVAARSAGTLVLLESVTITGNEAGVGGAGIYAADDAQISLGGGRCTTGFCPSTIANNRLSAGSGDGVAALAADGVIDLRQTEVRNNSIDDDEPHGSVLDANGLDGVIRTESVAIVGNTGADRVFEVTGGALVRAAFTTAARNRYFNDAAVLSEALAFYAAGSGSKARSFTSIFYPTAGFSIAPGVTTQFDCLIVQTTAGLPGTASEIYAVNPGYVDLPHGNVHVGDASTAVDFCDTFYLAPTVGDLDGRLRGHDLPGNPSGLPGPVGGASLQDAGAYELWELLDDAFETGSTARWDFTRP